MKQVKQFFLKDESPTLSWNFVPRLIRICRIQWWCSLFLFLIGHILLRWPSLIWKSNGQSKLKFCTNTNLNTQNSMVMFFFCFQLEVTFVGGNLFAKIKLCCWNLKLEPRLFQIYRIPWWFSFFFLF